MFTSLHRILDVAFC